MIGKKVRIIVLNDGEEEVDRGTMTPQSKCYCPECGRQCSLFLSTSIRMVYVCTKCPTLEQTVYWEWKTSPSRYAMTTEQSFHFVEGYVVE